MLPCSFYPNLEHCNKTQNDIIWLEREGIDWNVSPRTTNTEWSPQYWDLKLLIAWKPSVEYWLEDSADSEGSGGSRTAGNSYFSQTTFLMLCGTENIIRNTLLYLSSSVLTIKKGTKFKYIGVHCSDVANLHCKHQLYNILFHTQLLCFKQKET